VTDEQKAPAREPVAFLHSKPMQERGCGSPPTRNPFSRLAAYGIRIDLPPAVELPDGAVVRNLMMMGSRIVGAK